MRRVSVVAFVVAFVLGCGGGGVDKKGVNNSANNGANNGSNNGANNGSNNGANNGSNNGANNGSNNGNPDEDDDGDGISNADDNCPRDANPNQLDIDGDGVGNACDNCVDTANLDQTDDDGDGTGDACADGHFYTRDRDSDGDGIADLDDNCLATLNPTQVDNDGDGVGDSCDNCPGVPNAFQDDADGDGIGDSCSPQPAGMLCNTTQSEGEADVWLLVDNSGSVSQYEQEYRTVLANFASLYADTGRFGISGQSSNFTCMDTVYLNLGNYTVQQLSTGFGSIQFGGGSTPNTAVRAVSAGQYLIDGSLPGDASRTKILILMTDNSPNSCLEMGTAAQWAGILAGDGITTHVIGYHFDSSAPQTWLQEVATAGGGTAASANDGTQLLNELQRIMDSLPSACSFVLDDLPDPNRVWVSVNGTYLSRGNVDGFTVDPGSRTVTLLGAACDQSRAGATVEVQVGCAAECVPANEVCNYLDDDCNGLRDEGCVDCAPEVCNGVDDDCDEVIDEGCP